MQTIYFIPENFYSFNAVFASFNRQWPKQHRSILNFHQNLWHSYDMIVMDVKSTISCTCKCSKATKFDKPIAFTVHISDPMWISPRSNMKQNNRDPRWCYPYTIYHYILALAKSDKCNYRHFFRLFIAQTIQFNIFKLVNIQCTPMSHSICNGLTAHGNLRLSPASVTFIWYDCDGCKVNWFKHLQMLWGHQTWQTNCIYYTYIQSNVNIS